MIILAYHLISNVIKNEVTIPWGEFISQMEWLREENFNFVSLEDLTMNFNSNISKSVAITFDDGYKNTVLDVLPYLKENAIVASMAVNAGFLTKRISYKKIPHNIKELADVREVDYWLESGMNICGHTYSHAKLVDISNIKKEWQVAYDKQILEDLYNIRIKNFMYPYGMWNQDCINIIKKYYQYAYATDNGQNFGINNHTIRRVEILPGWSNDEFRLAIVGGEKDEDSNVLA